MNTPPRTRPNANRNGTLDDELKLIRRKLNALKISWAISGSMATKLHANSIGVPLHRLPNDIDIVIRPKDVGTVIMALAEIGYTSNSPPPIRFHHIKLYHGRFSLDLLSAGGNLAPNITANNIVVINKTPIVKIRHLMTQKNRVIANRFISNINKATASGNKNFLEKLSKHV